MTIVVGVDGSAGARAALAFAVDEGRLRGAGVHAVTAWHVPVEAYGSAFVPPPDVGFASGLEDAARRSLERVLEEQGAAGVVPVVREGPAARVLLEEARDADLLVVGSRGLGGFRGLMMGSVSQQCAHHATCPLVIVPNTAPALDPGVEP
jgi:nucleotide-binding universal stress UspA family protein